MTSETINAIRSELMTAPKTVPDIRRATGHPIQVVVDALVHLRGNGEAVCEEAEVDGRMMTVWRRSAGGVE